MPCPRTKSGDGFVHVARYDTNGMDVFTRNELVDLGNHAVPVEQHIKRHDRRDDE